MRSEAGARPVLRGLSILFGVACVLVVIAAIQLFVLSSRTDRFFAWTIGVPLTAAVDGAFYLAAFLLLLPAARAVTWIEVRPVAWGVLTISSVKLAATLLHLSPFHLTAGETTARIAAWGWLAVYVLVPIVLAALIVAELRLPGGNPPPVRPMPRPLRWTTGILAAVLVVVGLALLVALGATADRWPWTLTDLTAQALSAWFVGIGVVGVIAILDGDVVRARPVWMAALALPVLQGIALARYGDAFDWGAACGWLYLGLFAWVGVVGGWGSIASRS
jgi:uncharacterized protein YhhL (DUF1145 family)